MKHWLVIITLCLFLFIKCDEENGCYDSVNTLMVVSLKSSDFSVYNDLVIHGIGRQALGDTILADTLSSQNKRFALPLSLSEDSTGFVFLIGNTRDTVFFNHTFSMKFISETCGFAPEYDIISTSFSPGIDSVVISDRVVNSKSIQKNINDQNIIIYFNSAVH